MDWDCRRWLVGQSQIPNTEQASQVAQRLIHGDIKRRSNYNTACIRTDEANAPTAVLESCPVQSRKCCIEPN